MKALVLCGDPWHQAEIARAGLSQLPSSEFTFEWIEDTGEWSPQSMMACPLVVLTKSGNASSSDTSGWMTEAIQANFAEYVRRGNGLLAIHSGTAGYNQMPVLRGLLGGVFDHHPEQSPVTVTPHVGHPLCAGSGPFTSRDEHYFISLDDPEADVFLTTTSAHGEQPGGWRRLEGSGRVAVLTPGHNEEVWLHPSFQTLLLNCLRWCARP
jgi:type 1 glutamine amidotransferase